METSLRGAGIWTKVSINNKMLYNLSVNNQV